MKMSLSQRIYFFTICCCTLFILLVASIIRSSDVIELAIKQENYAQNLVTHTNILKQLIMSGDIYKDNYNASNWHKSQRELITLLKRAPTLTPQEQTLKNSIHSQNLSVQLLFKKINNNKLLNASEATKKHLKTRLIIQLETIRSDSEQLSTIAQKNIHQVLKQEVAFIVTLLAICLILLTFGSFHLIKIFRTSMTEIKAAFHANHSGHFEEIKLSNQSQEFESIANAFNAMNEKLSKSTVSLEVMKQVVEERTHVLEELSNTDSLTKVANRRALFERGHIEISRAQRSKNNLTIILLDCDLFKEFNDKYGHLIGDEVLVNICKVCSNEIREIDFLGRYGGEEFVIILPDCDIDGGLETARRIQDSLAHHSVAVKNQKIHITLSIGLATFNEKHKSFEELINDADRAMYFAKENGRNRIEIYQDINLH
ncbi:GGDEF domain-containing protein [Colwellia sp. 1_MG-2023]|uniref:GGDEF domain-containing protein n=1 Tax=Colwellia sp. 1_MG-2023 TaxID=3062649 RepID=UPI0026E31656|nr:GGDEF domain-containing protein [Colwellia sp. 1_MG-2023]MDO6446838.1 GGDEF domain-containing protein [Colwellia sp. 1_MG-2023]